MNKQKTCIILPCYKVKNNIYKVYKKLIQKNFNLIFVDDKCPQNSVSYLKSKIEINKKTQFIFLKKNLGVGGATLEGFKLAQKQRFDIIIKFDSDNQHKVVDLEKIIKKLQNNNVEFCKGYRILSLKKSLKRKMPLIRIFGASALTFLSNLTTRNFQIRDVTNGLFGIKSKILKKINLKEIKKNYFFEQDLIFRALKKNIKIYQINSEVVYKDETSSLSTLKSVIPFLFYHIQNLFYKN